jgi:predicted transposase YbfD/YdcC
LPITPALSQLAELAAPPPSELEPAECTSLLEYLSRIPDPRARRGIRHTWCSLLAIAAVAVLTGARSFTAVAEWAADAPQQVLALLGVRRDPLTGRLRSPHEATVRRALTAVDADALDAAVSSWITARMNTGTTATGRRPIRAVAVDGKTLRGARRRHLATLNNNDDGTDGTDGTDAVHLLAAIDHTSGAVLAQTDVHGKTNEITRFRPLLHDVDLAGHVVTADALHIQRDHATFLVTEKNAHDLLIVKRNQPSLHRQLTKLPWRQVAIHHRSKDRGHGREERRTLKVVSVKRSSASRPT